MPKDRDPPPSSVVRSQTLLLQHSLETARAKPRWWLACTEPVEPRLFDDEPPRPRVVVDGVTLTRRDVEDLLRAAARD